MGSEVTLDTLKGFLDAFNRHDLDAIMDYFHEDCVFYMPRGKGHGAIATQESKRSEPAWPRASRVSQTSTTGMTAIGPAAPSAYLSGRSPAQGRTEAPLRSEGLIC